MIVNQIFIDGLKKRFKPIIILGKHGSEIR